LPTDRGQTRGRGRGFVIHREESVSGGLDGSSITQRKRNLEKAGAEGAAGGGLGKDLSLPTRKRKKGKSGPMRVGRSSEGES